mgnify:FL=1
MNHFKKVNDTFGHTAGDKCLCTVAQGLREVYGVSGRSFRLGAFDTAEETLEEAFNRADQAMYQEKNARHAARQPSEH